jgi:malonyl-CoA O-methyltransferase
MRWWKKKREPSVLSPLEGYNLWASTYSKESNPIKNLSDTLVEKFLPSLEGKTVLDAGCGTGKFCKQAENQNALKVVGIDLSPAMIEEAKLVCSKTEFRCSDISNTNIEQSHYDVIICGLVMGHLQSLIPSLPGLLKALKNGGIIILTDFHPFLTMLHLKRTFNDNRSGKEYEIRHHLHLFQDYFKMFSDHGVVIESLEEPMYNGNPVVFGIRAQKV